MSDPTPSGPLPVLQAGGGGRRGRRARRSAARPAAAVQARGRGRLAVRAGALAVAAAALLGLLLGFLWWALAPVARAQVQGDQVVLVGHQELQAAQDGWFVVVTGLAGVLVATVVALRPSAREAGRAVLAVLVTGAAGVAAWWFGAALGPAALGTQVRAGATHPLTPLALHAHSVLLVGPLLCAVTLFVGALLSGGRGRP